VTTAPRTHCLARVACVVYQYCAVAFVSSAVQCVLCCVYAVSCPALNPTRPFWLNPRRCRRSRLTLTGPPSSTTSEVICFVPQFRSDSAHSSRTAYRRIHGLRFCHCAHRLRYRLNAPLLIATAIPARLQDPWEANTDMGELKLQRVGPICVMDLVFPCCLVRRLEKALLCPVGLGQQ